MPRKTLIMKSKELWKSLKLKKSNSSKRSRSFRKSKRILKGRRSKLKRKSSYNNKSEPGKRLRSRMSKRSQWKKINQFNKRKKTNLQPKLTQTLWSVKWRICLNKKWQNLQSKLVLLLTSSWRLKLSGRRFRISSPSLTNWHLIDLRLRQIFSKSSIMRGLSQTFYYSLWTSW